MRRIVRSLVILSAVLLVAAVTLAGPAQAGAPGTWTKLSDGTGSLTYSSTLLRTADGRLHVVWPKTVGQKTAYGSSTIAETGKLLSTSTILTWAHLNAESRLIPDGAGGLRLVFSGLQDANTENPYSSGAMLTATSPTGNTWTLGTQSLSHSDSAYGSYGTAATTKSDGTPVAAFVFNPDVTYHSGLDAAIPAADPDNTITRHGNPNPSLYYAALARDTNGSVWAAWESRFAPSDAGVWVQRILPSETPAIRAPDSFLHGNAVDALQQIAMVARPGGGIYVAYCAPDNIGRCAHVNLWKVGAAAAKTVPGSSGGNAANVALTPARDGRMWVSWYNSGTKAITSVRTNGSAAAFGAVRTIGIPGGGSSQLWNLSTEGTSGRLDVVANVTSGASGPIAFWHTQVLAGLSLSASPSSFNNNLAHTVTFTVRDAGLPIGGARVRVGPKSAMTNSAGVAKITFAKGTAAGHHVATASKANYWPGTVTLVVT